jgi:hypothetical protein
VKLIKVEFGSKEYEVDLDEKIDFDAHTLEVVKPMADQINTTPELLLRVMYNLSRTWKQKWENESRWRF